jgi:hypothetical protein
LGWGVCRSASLDRFENDSAVDPAGELLSEGVCLWYRLGAREVEQDSDPASYGVGCAGVELTLEEDDSVSGGLYLFAKLLLHSFGLFEVHQQAFLQEFVLGIVARVNLRFHSSHIQREGL